MNYIKSFESISSISDIISDIRFILSDLSDSGFYVVVGSIGNSIRVFIQGPETEYSVKGGRDHKSFKASVYKEYDVRIKDYLDDRLKSVNYSAFSYENTKKSNSFDDISYNVQFHGYDSGEDSYSTYECVIEEELVCDYELY